ncbi:MAG: L-serine ammonia-lyase, iron-sulfur-dependent, subunit alpha [Planctomycetes bacterium]|nr:L-serine ammonia-lyase, iron-sulfur-dependent, subunit alpha [Planctomycetota bacterium]
MESLKELYRVGTGPSASHTMGPRRAAEIFRDQNPGASSFRCTLYGSLAATGKGHLTDVAITGAFASRAVEIIWKPRDHFPFHPNAMDFVALDAKGTPGAPWRVYSVGGGALREEGIPPADANVYDLSTMADILKWCDTHNAPIWKYVELREGPGIWDFLRGIWATMQAAIERGLKATEILPGSLKLRRKSKSHYEQAVARPGPLRQTGLITAYALAVSEENAAGGVVATAPTCGACGLMPAVLRYAKETLPCGDEDIIHALATAGLVGNLVKTNASISGAAVGCQGEVGTACAMGAGAAAQLMGGTPQQIEYAAEMGFEHHLGLTCDPIGGLVQIPCIERNAVGATRALTCADYALLSDGRHEVPFDVVVKAMKRTGEDLLSHYRETSMGGLAAMHHSAGNTASPESNHCG